MNRAEVRRKEIIESGSPLAGHSINQRKIKSWLDGERRMAPGRKVMRAQTRAEINSTESLYEREKTQRVLSVVQASIWDEGRGNQFTKPELAAMVRYLTEKGLTWVQIAGVRPIKPNGHLNGLPTLRF